MKTFVEFTIVDFFFSRYKHDQEWEPRPPPQSGPRALGAELQTREEGLESQRRGKIIIILLNIYILETFAEFMVFDFSRRSWQHARQHEKWKVKTEPRTWTTTASSTTNWATREKCIVVQLTRREDGRYSCQHIMRTLILFAIVDFSASVVKYAQ